MNAINIGIRGRILIFALMLMLTSTAFPAHSAAASNATREDSLPAWTVLVYMSGDNNLEAAAIDDFNEMETVGSTDNVRIIVQFDRASGHDTTNGDWKDTRRYLIQRDENKNTINSTRLDKGLGELDMSKPATLRDFLLWGVDNYPARHYLVIMWDHGLGWEGGVCNDQGHYMSIFDMREALKEVKEQWNHTFDIIGFDACLMGGVEVYYQLTGFANYSFGSEKNEPTDGLPYNNFLDTLVKNPGIPIETLLDTIVSDYIWSYRGISPISVTYGAVNLTRFPMLSDSLNNMLNELDKEMPFYLSEVREARSATEEYEKGNHYYYVDFLDLVRNIAEKISNPKFQSASLRLENTLNGTIVSSQSWNVYGDNSDTVRNATGMTIYFPDPSTGSKDVPRFSGYLNTQFARDTLFDEFLEELFRYNDNDYLAEHSLRASLSVKPEPAQMDAEGNIDRLLINYSLSPIKGNSTDNLTLTMTVSNATGVEVLNTTIPDLPDDGNLSFNVKEHGFDFYTFHLYLTDTNGTLQDYREISYDFEKSGVKMRAYLKDEKGEERPANVLNLMPGENITCYIEVQNTGNARRLFRLDFSGVPYKYNITYDSHAFALEPGEKKVFSVNIGVSERSHVGTDTFEFSVRCLENGSVYNSSLMTINVKEKSSGQTAVPVEIIAGIALALISGVILGMVMLQRRRNRRLQSPLTLPIQALPREPQGIQGPQMTQINRQNRQIKPETGLQNRQNSVPLTAEENDDDMTEIP